MKAYRIVVDDRTAQIIMRGLSMTIEEAVKTRETVERQLIQQLENQQPKGNGNSKERPATAPREGPQQQAGDSVN